MKKAVNATTFVALALAASVTYNIVQHQRAKGIRPEDHNQEDNAVQSVAGKEEASAVSAATAAQNSASATKPASAVQQSTSITFRSARYDKYDDELEISFSTPSSLPSKLAKDAIEFTPAVPNLSFYANGSTISVSGGFKPGVSYRVRVKKGLMDRSGKATLENDAVFDVTIPELTERFSFLTNGSVFPLTADRIEFPYSSRNLKKFTLKLYRGFENNLAFASGNDNVYAMELVGEKTVTLSDPRNETINHMLDLTDILDDRAKISHPFEGMLRFRPGHYVLEVEYDRKSDWSDDYTYRETERRTFTLTDFAMVAASVSNPSGGLAVFVRRISDGKPVADAEIELRTDKNQLVGTYKTDSNGKAFTEPLPRLNHGVLYSAAIRKGEEFAWFPLELNLDDFKSHGDMAFVFTERGIVRPGETFLAASFIRHRKNGAGKTIYNQFPDATMPPPSKSGLSYSPYKISLIAPDGKQILSEEVHGDEMGFLSQMIRVPDTAVSGVYTVRVASGVSRMGETTIRVGAYVPDRIKAKLEHAALPAGPAAVKEPIQAVLSADYYFGTPYRPRPADSSSTARRAGNAPTTGRTGKSAMPPASISTSSKRPSRSKTARRTSPCRRSDRAACRTIPFASCFRHPCRNRADVP